MTGLPRPQLLVSPDWLLVVRLLGDLVSANGDLLLLIQAVLWSLVLVLKRPDDQRGRPCFLVVGELEVGFRRGRVQARTRSSVRLGLVEAGSVS